jgi:hypothetical protein
MPRSPVPFGQPNSDLNHRRAAAAAGVDRMPATVAGGSVQRVGFRKGNPPSGAGRRVVWGAIAAFPEMGGACPFLASPWVPDQRHLRRAGAKSSGRGIFCAAPWGLSGALESLPCWILTA